MVFKPWSELKTPRHLMTEEDEEFAVESPIPSVSIQSPNDFKSLKGTLIILPSSLKFLDDALKKHFPDSKSLTKLIITKLYPKNEEYTDEFIEEEQLYSTNKNKEYEEAVSSELEIVQYSDTISVVVVPHYEHDKILYSILSRKLIESINDELQILSITPGSLEFGELIGELSSSSSSTTFKKLVPPFFITGIAASITSNGELLKKSKQIRTLVLQSEGVSGFEKIHSDSVGELSQYLIKKFHLNKGFAKDCDSLLQSGKNVNSFGLYL